MMTPGLFGNSTASNFAMPSLAPNGGMPGNVNANLAGLIGSMDPTTLQQVIGMLQQSQKPVSQMPSSLGSQQGASQNALSNLLG
jgi:uncharacterized protein YgbK (DUF1537 family)